MNLQIQTVNKLEKLLKLISINEIPIETRTLIITMPEEQLATILNTINTSTTELLNEHNNQKQ